VHSGTPTIVRSQGTILVLDANAENPTRISVNTEETFRAIAIGTDGKQLAVGDHGIAYVSQDHGQSFQEEKTGTTHLLTQVIALPKRARFVIGADQGKILLRDDPGEWRLVDTASASRISALTILPDGVLVAGTLDGLLLRSTDDGETWADTQKNSTNTAVIGITSNPNASLLLARTKSTALMVSTNKGKQFQPLSPEPKQAMIEIAWMPGRGFFGVGINGDTFRSDWNGKQWIRESAQPLDRPLAMAILPKTQTLLVVGRSGLIARSTDRGKQYQIVRPGLGDSLRSFADNSPAGCLVAVGMKATILRSTDEGDHWERIPLDIDPTVNLTAMVVEPKTHALLAGGTRGTLLRSVDCARTWTPIQATHEDINFLLASEHSGVFALANRSGIFRSQDAGLTFVPVKMQWGTTLRQIVSLSSTDLVAVGDEGMIFRSQDKGDQFQIVPSPSKAHLRALVYNLVHRTLLTAGDHGTVLASRDDGETWETMAVPTEEDLHVIAFGLNGSKIWFGGNRGTVLYSTNAGVSFTSLPTGSSQAIRVITFDPPSKEFFIAAVDGTLHRSTGEHLTQIPTSHESGLYTALFYKPTGTLFMGGDRLIRIGASNP
jgi:photosystem II stability/assembly factor-like uncharacterized protein